MPSRRGRMEPRIIPSGDCGNSPKNTLLQDMAIAFAKRDARFLLDHVTDDIRWEVVSAQVVEGKDAFAHALEKLSLGEVTQVTIEHVVSHGRTGAINGFVQHSATTSDFCDVFEFANAKGERVKTIRSYVIERTS
jgi:SnoaL-like domain